MYDLGNSRAKRAIVAKQMRWRNRRAMRGRWRLKAPMYEVRFSMYDLGELPREAREFLSGLLVIILPEEKALGKRRMGRGRRIRHRFVGKNWWGELG